MQLARGKSSSGRGEMQLARGKSSSGREEMQLARGKSSSGREEDVTCSGGKFIWSVEMQLAPGKIIGTTKTLATYVMYYNVLKTFKAPKSAGMTSAAFPALAAAGIKLTGEPRVSDHR